MYRIVLFTTILVGTLTYAQGPGQTPTEFDFQTKALPSGSVGATYTATIQVSYGTPPLSFSVIRGKLPPGIIIQPNSGILSGTPTAVGVYPFTVQVSNGVGQKITLDFAINIEDLLSVKWLQPPRLNSNVLGGRVEVTNSSREPYDLTIIIVAVNEVGKAFALGYQRFNLGSQIKQPIPFSSLLPNGSYIVHVDVIGEIPARNAIRRTRLQTQQPIVVNVNR